MAELYGLPDPNPELSQQWQERAEDIATWLDARYVLRSDRFGVYVYTKLPTGELLNDGNATGPLRGAPNDKLNHKRLFNHIANAGKVALLCEGNLDRHREVRVGKESGLFLGATVGAHCSSTDDRCKRIRVDLDAHATDSQPEDAERNHRFALYLAAHARTWGLAPLLWDSDGRGGLWLEVLFTEPVPTPFAHELGGMLIQGWEQFGFRERPETFPKQQSINTGKGKGCGNWTRLPGLHHKRPRWARLWHFDRGEWLSGSECVDAMLSHGGNSAEAVERLSRRLFLISDLRPEPATVKLPVQRLPAAVATAPLDPGAEAAKVRALRKYAEKIGCSGEGARSNNAYKIAANGIRDKGLSQESVYDVLREWNRGNSPPLEPHQLEDILRNGGNYAKGVYSWQDRSVKAPKSPQVVTPKKDKFGSQPSTPEAARPTYPDIKKDTHDKSDALPTQATYWDEGPRRYCERPARILAEGAHEKTFGDIAGIRPSCGCWWHPPCHHNKRLDFTELYCPRVAACNASVTVWRGPQDKWAALLKHVQRKLTDDDRETFRYITVAPSPDAPMFALFFSAPASPRLTSITPVEAAHELAVQIKSIYRPVRDDDNESRFRPLNAPDFIPFDEETHYYELAGERVPPGTPGAKKKKIRLYNKLLPHVKQPPSLCAKILDAAGVTNAVAHMADDVEGSDGKSIREFSGKNWDKVPPELQADVIEKIAGRRAPFDPLPTPEDPEKRTWSAADFDD